MKKLLSFLTAMALATTASAQEGMSEGIHTSGTKILDAKNNELVLRGVNYSWAWQRGHEETVIPAAKRIGCNAIRIQLSTGERQKQGVRPEWDRCEPEELERLIELCENNKLIAVFNTHDETGDDDYSSLEKAVEFWISMKEILNAHLKTVIVNVSNEWYGSWGSWPWADGYKKAIPRLREAGIRNMLLVDCAGWGQYPQSIFEAGTSVVEADPLGNMAFSIHFYEYSGGSSQAVRDNIWNALHISKPVPLVVGEFAYAHKDGAVAWEEILSYSFEHHVGYLAWSWTGNGEGAEMCDLFADWEGTEYRESGRCIIPSTYGITDTSKECSYFDDAVAVNAEDYNPFRDGAGNGDDNHGSGGGGNTGGDDEYDPSVEEPLDISGSRLEENLTILDKIGYKGSWDNLYHVTKEQLGTLRRGDKIHLYVSAGGNAQLQLAYATPSKDWNQLADKNIGGWSRVDIDVENQDGHPEFIRGLNYDGLRLKGQDYTLDRVAVTRRVPIISGVGTVGQEAGQQGIDFTLPFEIFTIDGRRVAEMSAGSLYILRQGNVVVKHLAR